MTNEEFENIFGNVPFENIEKIKKYIQEIIKQQEENKKKDEIIELMAEKLAKAYHYKMNECSLKKKEQNNIDCNKYKDCTICVKQYFANKVDSKIQ